MAPTIPFRIGTTPVSCSALIITKAMSSAQRCEAVPKWSCPHAKLSPSKAVLMWNCPNVKLKDAVPMRSKAVSIWSGMMLSLGSPRSVSCHPDCTACVDTFPAVLGFAASNGNFSEYIYTFGSAVFIFCFTKLKGVILKTMLSLLLLCILLLSLRSQQCQHNETRQIFLVGLTVMSDFDSC